MEFKNIGEMINQVMLHLKKGRSNKEYYTLMYVVAGPSCYLLIQKKVKTHVYIGTGVPGLKKYGCSRFKVDCIVYEKDGNLRHAVEIVKKEKLSPSHQRRFNLKKKMLLNIYDCLLWTQTYEEIDQNFKLWLLDTLTEYNCANEAYPNIIKDINNIAYSCHIISE